ncbi:hypothetical protein OTU49_002802 [Cherax quadricarinatus]|uniref:Innexin n=1 Tax=Cherax quadricarinatus TaxID=27406 RepID=A0AAW0XMP4_CHEQU
MMFKAISSIKVKVELKPVVDNLVFRLHYRYTYTIYMVSMLLCTIYDIIGDKISCMTGIDSDAYNDVVSNFCFIMGTFTVDRLHGVKIGAEAPHPGVGPQQPGDNVTFHTYYQWVPFVLFIQWIFWVYSGSDVLRSSLAVEEQGGRPFQAGYTRSLHS